MHGFLPIFFLLVVLKIPVLGALWLVWWAAQEPESDEEASPGDDGHGRKPPFRPRPRGPHGAPQPPSLRRRGEEAGVHPELRRPVAREAGNPAGREAHQPPPYAT